ncbi:MAG: hypothetical protein AAB888_00785 [Patescibacteria group bacterium]|mgnify:CR=1 FL=1
MFNIEGLLKKFKSITPPDDHIKNTASLVVLDKVKINISKEKIKLINNTIHIDASPAVKSVIFRNKTDILNEINNRSGGNSPISDIR